MSAFGFEFRSLRRLFRPLLGLLALLGGASSVAIGVCGPFTDVSDTAFCPFVLEIFTLGITTGTTPTTYDPVSGVSRLQMAAFLSRSVDAVLRRGSRRSVVKKFWTPQNAQVLGLTSLGGSSLPNLVDCDGANVWVANGFSGTVSRVRQSDGRLLATWTGAAEAYGVLAAMGRVFVTGASSAQKLYRIDPSQPAGAVTTVATDLGINASGIAFDGSRVWTANTASSVSIVTPAASLPWSVTTVTAGFQDPFGILYDGSNIWVTDYGPGTLLKLDASGTILQTVTVGLIPSIPAFDGTNVWVPNGSSDSVSVVRASSGAVLATLTGNGLAGPLAAGFDGQRILVTNYGGSGVSLWKSADLMPLGSVAMGASGSPAGVCSDGVSFWLALAFKNQIARF